MSEQSCSTCRYWRGTGRSEFHRDAEYAIGACRIRAPRVVDALIDDQLDTRLWDATCFPIVAADDWCGEFEESPAATNARLAELDTAEAHRSFEQSFAKAHSPQGDTAGVGHLLHDDDAPW